MKKYTEYYEFPSGTVVKVKDYKVYEYYPSEKIWKENPSYTAEFAWDKPYGKPCRNLHKKVDLSEDLPPFPSEKEFYPGNEVIFGAYPQNSEHDFSPVRWEVLEIDGDTALCISKKALITSGYCEITGNAEAIMWENSLARKVCNEFFYEAAFSEEEKARIVPREPDALKYGKKCADPVFLLSQNEVERYFPLPESRKAVATPYAKMKGVYNNLGGEEAFWWILPEETHHTAIYPKAVTVNGEFCFHSRNIGHGDFTIRPCVRVRFTDNKTEPVKPLKSVGLIYTPLTKKALRICFKAHENQYDKSGMPYVIHPLHLAEQMETEYEVCAALLHDVAEDSNYELKDLIAEGFPDEILDAVKLLTRKPHENYISYVTRLRKNPIARRVKMADLIHNGTIERLDNVSDADRIRLRKYRMAYTVLQEDKKISDEKIYRKRFEIKTGCLYYLDVYYDSSDQVKKYVLETFTGKIAEVLNSHFALDFIQGEKLRKALDGTLTLPEAIDKWALRQIHLTQNDIKEMLDTFDIEYTVSSTWEKCKN